MIACLLPAKSRAQHGAPVDRVAFALRFLDLAYPDVRRGATNIYLGASVYPFDQWLRELGIQFSDSGGGLEAVGTRGDLSTVYFHDVFRFDDNGLMSYEAFGRFLKYRENAALAERVSLNDDWSDSEVAAALQRAGARFGPERESMKSQVAILANGLARIIGTESMTVKDISFNYSTVHERSTGLGVGSVGWQGVLVPSGGGRFEYVASYEPMGGKLVSFDRRARQ
jgi:hypothetical protein